MTIFNRKGNAVLETLTLALIIIVLSISTIFTYQLFDGLNDEIQTDVTMTAEAKNVSSNLHAVYPSLFDNILLFSLALLVIGVVVSVFLLDTHPIFIFVSVVLLLSVFAVMLLLSNTYDDIASDPSISTFAGAFPYTNWIMTHFLTVMIAIGFIILIALFLKLRR